MEREAWEGWEAARAGQLSGRIKVSIRIRISSSISSMGPPGAGSAACCCPRSAVRHPHLRPHLQGTGPPATAAQAPAAAVAAAAQLLVAGEGARGLASSLWLPPLLLLLLVALLLQHPQCPGCSAGRRRGAPPTPPTLPTPLPTPRLLPPGPWLCLRQGPCWLQVCCRGQGRGSGFSLAGLRVQGFPTTPCPSCTSLARRPYRTHRICSARHWWVARWLGEGRVQGGRASRRLRGAKGERSEAPLRG